MKITKQKLKQGEITTDAIEMFNSKRVFMKTYMSKTMKTQTEQINDLKSHLKLF